MGVYVSGGGSGDGEHYQANGGTDPITLFTTADEDNTLFIVDYTWAANVTSTACLTIDTEVLPGMTGDTASLYNGKGSLRVGQNTAVKIVIPVMTSAADTHAIHYAYNYVKLVISP